jgi:hypothetical protein
MRSLPFFLGGSSERVGSFSLVFSHQSLVSNISSQNFEIVHCQENVFFMHPPFATALHRETCFRVS